MYYGVVKRRTMPYKEVITISSFFSLLIIYKNVTEMRHMNVNIHIRDKERELITLLSIK